MGIYTVTHFLKSASKWTAEGVDLDDVHDFSVDVDFRAADQKDLLKEITDFFNVEHSSVELNAYEEDGRIDVQVFENSEGESLSNVQVDKMLENNENVYLVNYSGYLELQTSSKWNQTIKQLNQQNNH